MATAGGGGPPARETIDVCGIGSTQMDQTPGGQHRHYIDVVDWMTQVGGTVPPAAVADGEDGEVQVQPPSCCS